LFAQANSLRRTGKLAQAAQLYQTLLERSPRAREAQPSRLALANLLAKQPAQALTQYRALARTGGGTFRLQGLWGVAETAASLGDKATETAALSELVRDFPGSPYAEIARQRLGNGNP
jgi:outer membrane protein assembly factor BamD (BamD/ComL family)